MKTASIYIDGYIGEGDVFSGASFSLSKLNQELSKVKDVDVLDVYINSGGGSVTEGFAIYDKLASLPYTVNTIVNGMCGSIATVIFQAGKGGKRKMFKNSKFFVHNPYWQPAFPEPMEAKDLELLAEDLKKAQTQIENFYSNITGKSVEEIKPILERQTELSASEAIEWGFADETVGEEVKAYTQYTLMAFLQNNKTNKMDNEIKNKLDELTGIKAFMAKIAKKLFKNGMITADSGDVMYFDGETIAVDTAVFADEVMSTPLADGSYEYGVNKVTVKDGLITEIVDKEAEANALADAQAKIADLEAKLASKDSELVAVNATVEETKAEVLAMFTKVKSFESMLVTGNFKAQGGQHQAGAEAPTAPMTTLEKIKAGRESEKNK